MITMYIEDNCMLAATAVVSLESDFGYPEV